MFLSSPAIYHEHQLITNMDWLINNKNTFSAKYFYTMNPQSIRRSTAPNRLVLRCQ